MNKSVLKRPNNNPKVSHLKDSRLRRNDKPNISVSLPLKTRRRVLIPQGEDVLQEGLVKYVDLLLM